MNIIYHYYYYHYYYYYFHNRLYINQSETRIGDKKLSVEQDVIRAGKIKFSGTRKSLLIKPSSGEHCTPRNFVLLGTLQVHVSVSCVCIIVYLVML